MAAAKCQRNGVGSLVVERAPVSNTAGGHCRHRTAFSGATFRRIIFDALSCGGSSRHRHGEIEDHIHNDISATTCAGKACEESKEKLGSSTRSEKLMDLLNLAPLPEYSKSEMETKKMEESLEKLKQIVKELSLEDPIKRKSAAIKVRFLTKEDPKARETLAMLGAIPPLVSMLDFEEDDDDHESLTASLYALLNLGIGNDANKTAIVKAGAIHRMMKLINKSENFSISSSVSEAIVANFLGLSALDSNKPLIGSSGAIPFLAKTVQKKSDNQASSQAKQDALRALYNLSIFPSNISIILETDLLSFMLNKLGDMEVSERILSILSNIVSTPQGRKAISLASPDAYSILIDVLNWTDSPACQEKGAYILMIMAHKVYRDRPKMLENGVVSACLELTLLGSSLAQERASRILECLRVDKGKQVSQVFGGNVSAPICGPSDNSSQNPNLGCKEYLEEIGDMVSEEKKAVKQLVQQSLQNNMRRIVKRANLPQDFIPSDHFKSLTSSSTSKSLPF